jgi:hypothetical protein
MQTEARDVENRKRGTKGATEYVYRGQEKLEAARIVGLVGHRCLAAVERHS